MSRTKYRNVVIVGAGLFGAMAAKLCALNGFKVTVIDSREKEAGSRAAACLMAPSWMAGLGKEKIEKGMEVLNLLYKVVDIPFVVNKVKTVNIKHVKPSSILSLSRIPNVEVVKDKVVMVGDGGVETIKGRYYKGNVLVAAGIWSEQLVVMPDIKALTGTALHFTQQTDPEVRVWAPYKQAVKFNITPAVTWFGDGTSILRKNFDDTRIEATVNRASKYGLKLPSRIIVGQRPYIEGEKGYFRHILHNTWVSTGGAKNGTILAAYQAQQFLEAIS